MKRILKKVMKRSERLENQKNMEFWEIFKERIFWREIELRGKGERDWGGNFIGHFKQVFFGNRAVHGRLLIKIEAYHIIDGNNAIP